MYHNKRSFGQATAEYIVLLPAGIMILIGASFITGFLLDAFGSSVELFEPYGLECKAPTYDEGPPLTTPGPHTVELTSHDYENGVTTITYTVTTSCVATIDHWVLGLPKGIADKIQEASENYSFASDDGTGITGIVFSNSYKNKVCREHGDNGVGNGEDAQPPGNPPINDGPCTGPGNPGNKGGADYVDECTGETLDGGKTKGPKTGYAPDGMTVMTSFSQQGGDVGDVSNTVVLLISGEYDFGATDVGVGDDSGSSYTSTISAPIRVHDPSLDQGCDS